MEIDSAVIVLIVIGMLAIWRMVTKSKVASILTRISISCVMIIALNCLLPQYRIGFNPYTIGFSSLLGLPGLMTLYLLKMFI